MNILTEKIVEAFRVNAAIKRADKLLSGKPEGFHPSAKKIYRRECRVILGSIENRIEEKQRGRIVGNKSISNGTKLRIEKLRNIAR